MKKPNLIIILLSLILVSALSITADPPESLSDGPQSTRDIPRHLYPSRFDPDQRLQIPDGFDPRAQDEIKELFDASRDEIVGEYISSALWSGMKDVAYADGLAYCAVEYGLVIVDVSDPSAPAFVSQLTSLASQ